MKVVKLRWLFNLMFLKANLRLASRLGLSKNALRLLNCNIRSKSLCVVYRASAHGAWRIFTHFISGVCF